MQDKEFNVILRKLNFKYKEVFDYIPQITDYSCSREEYIKALNSAINSKKDISMFIDSYR